MGKGRVGVCGINYWLAAILPVTSILWSKDGLARRIKNRRNVIRLLLIRCLRDAATLAEG
jgi:hypothetical protein